MLGYLIALGCYWWLWPKAKDLVFEEAPLPQEQLRKQIRWSGVFVSFWMVFGIGYYAVRMINDPVNYMFFGVIKERAVDWISYTASAPVLGATLLVLGIETQHATNSVEGLLRAARAKTLTRSMYTKARDRIRDRSASWKLSLGLMALAAFYSTIGLVYALQKNGRKVADDVSSTK